MLKIIFPHRNIILLLTLVLVLSACGLSQDPVVGYDQPGEEMAHQEVPGDLVIDIGFEKHAPHFPKAIPDHGLRKDPTLPELGKNPVQLVTQVVEHDATVTSSFQAGSIEAGPAKLGKLAITQALLKV